MNTLMLVALAVVALCYCGGKYCPKVLSSNKEMLLGVLVGMALCSFAGLKLEGLDHEEEGDGPIYGGEVTASEPINSQLMDANDLTTCMSRMAVLRSGRKINARQYAEAVRACNTRYSEDRSNRGP